MGASAYLLAQHGQDRAIRGFIAPRFMVGHSHDWRYDGSPAMAQHYNAT